jgi:rubrerythrin
MAVHPDILEALTSGIQSEVASYVFYVEASKKAKTEDFKNTLHKLAGEEKRHFHILEKQYDSLVRSEKWISTADILKEEGLPEIGEEMTSRHQGLVDEVRGASNQRQILDIALRLEYEARDLFGQLANKAESREARETFEFLSKFEQTHVEIIKGMIADLD